MSQRKQKLIDLLAEADALVKEEIVAGAPLHVARHNIQTAHTLVQQHLHIHQREAQDKPPQTNESGG